MTAGGIEVAAAIKIFTGKGIAVETAFASEGPFALLIPVDHAANKLYALDGKRVIDKTFGISCFDLVLEELHPGNIDQRRVQLVKDLHPV